MMGLRRGRARSTSRRCASGSRRSSRRLAGATTRQLESQGVRIVRGTRRLSGPHRGRDAGRSAPTATRSLEADAILISTGASAGARVGGGRRRPGAHHPPGLSAAGDPRAPDRDRLGRHRRRVRAHVPLARLGGHLDRLPPAGAADEGSRGRGGARGRLPRRGRHLLKGARAVGRSTDDAGGARLLRRRPHRSTGRHALLAIGSIPQPPASASKRPASRSTTAVTCPSTTTASRTSRTSMRPATCRAGSSSPRSAAMQGRKIAEHVMGLHTREHRHLDYDKAASAIFTEPEIADVGLAEAEAFALGRKIRVTRSPLPPTPRR